MINMIKTDKLKEHHKNGYYFTDIEGEKYEEVKRSIQENGIRDPIKCTRDYTVISGHQRLRIARDLNMGKVPYQMLDVDEKEAEYLLIAENVERRGQAETDPIKKSRIANFLKEYWGVQRGNNQYRIPQNGESKTSKDIAEVVGVPAKHLDRVVRLNDLIPELQELISEGKLGQTAGEQLAHLTEDNQRALLSVLGKEIEKTTVNKAKQYREEEAKSKENNIDYKKQLELMKKQLEQAKQSEEIALRRLEEEQEKEPKTPKVIEKEVVKEVIPEEVTRKYEQAQQEKRQLEHSLMRTYERIEELEKIEKSVRTQEESPLYDIIRSLQTVNRNVDSFTISPRRAESVIDSASDDVVGKLETEIRRAVSKMEGLLGSIDKRNGAVVVDTENTINTMEVINYD